MSGTRSLDSAEALTVVRESITAVVPDADFTRVRPHDRFRDVLELDSLDFLSLVEILSEQAGVPIDEDDYPRLTTLADSVEFLVERTKQYEQSRR
ncbi:acyl carrier protein [Streptomyces actuosus]|uniref:Acyl carrier protein n=1 Tax=Streptomyces actuosus TaxID=1885 RepID=A0ABS2VI57_STRAS|nr:phosphopantetheine-binding protein [Streptomyces actuosus]MBN0042768.1 acyl carrier protein [Streptomyces actuosus]